MASMNDEALEIIWREGGKAHVHRVAGLMKISSDYARAILHSLGRQDYLDIGPDDVAVLTNKGKETLDRRGILKKNEEEKKREKEVEEKKMKKRILEY